MAGRKPSTVPAGREIVEIADHYMFFGEAEAVSREHCGRFDRAKFLQGARGACESLASDLQQPSALTFKKEMQGLVASIDRAIESRDERLARVAANKLKRITPAVRDWTNKIVRTRPNRAVPQFENWPDDSARDEAFIAIRSLLTNGGRMVLGRIRPGGKRSKGVFVWNILLPAESSSGRPAQEAARLFIMHMRLACVAAGYNPPLTSHRQQPPKFASMVGALAERVGAQFSTSEMINAWAAVYHKANPDEPNPKRAASKTVRGFPRKKQKNT